MGDAGPKTNPRAGGTKSPWMPSLRKRGEKLLHSKYLVSLVIILTIVDCSLVIAELILDLYSVKKTLLLTESQTFKFIKNIRARYPDQVKPNDTVASFYDRMAYSIILWNSSHDMDFFNSADNFQTDPTSTEGMLHPFTPVFQTEIQEQTPVWETNSQTVLVEDSDSPVSHTAHQIRRSQERRTSFGQSGRHYQDNERRRKSNSDVEIRRLFRRVRRYVLNGLHNSSIQSIRTVTTAMPSNIENYGVSGDYSYYNEFSNESSRQLDDLVLLNKMITEIITMQINSSQMKNVEYSNTNTAAEVSKPDADNEYENNDVNSPSVILSVLPDNDSEEDSSYSNTLSADVSQYHYFVSDNSNSGPEDQETRGSRSRRNSGEYEENMRRDLHHSAEMEIAHKLHYASVCVSSILVFEVTLKIICEGSRFVKRKIQVFDAIVIVTSIIVDLIFMKGLPEFAVDDSIFVLALLLPWRVIRVVNSLVMAVIDHEQVKLRLLYSRKKKLDKTVESLRNEMDEIKGTMQEVRSFCIKEGMESVQIDGMLGKFAPRRRKDSKFYTLVKLVMSTASINNNDNDSISSSSIENDLRHCINKDSVLNLAASSRGTMTSLKQYLSVPFNNDDSHSLSDGDSLAGDHPGLSPSIYITSPVSDDGRGMMGFCGVNMEDNDVVMTSQEPTAAMGKKDKVATITVTSNTTNVNTANGVSFFVGSQTSLDIGDSQSDLSDLENYSSQKESGRRASFSGIPADTAASTAFDTNKNVAHHQFGKFLTVPNGSENVTPALTPIVSSLHSNNNNMTDVNNVSDATHGKPLPQKSKEEIKRSASENLNASLGFSPYEGVHSHGSPSHARRLPEVRTKRKIYSRSHSESEDNEMFEKLKRDRAGRIRRNSGDAQAHLQNRVLEPHRARSHSPSPVGFLAVPGSNRVTNNVTCSSSRSMNDVSTAGSPQKLNSGGGVTLQRSCLSLNTDGQKRRDKSPHRVSFKVS